MGLWKVSTANAFNTTLNGNIGAEDSTITLTSVSGLQYPGVIVVDRQNTLNVDTPTVREYISYTGISSNNLTGCARGLGGSTGQTHTSGAKVEEVFTITHWNDLITALLNILTAAGALDTTKVVDLTTSQVLTNKDITSATNSLPVTLTNTVTLTNKRKTRRVGIVTQSATPAINTDNVDVATITGLNQAITSMTASLTGTPVAQDLLEIQITDDGTGRAITWGASFVSTTATLPTTTVISTLLRCFFEWNGTAWAFLGSV